MSGIPVYTQSPINAAQPTGVTPQTAAAANQQAASHVPATTTAASDADTPYPRARPGAAASVPTAAPSRYAPLQPTPTAVTRDEGPPPPQANEFPTPLHSSNPPPPKAGETYHPPPPQQTAAPASTYQPPQMGIPPPTEAIGSRPPPSTTNTTNLPSSSYPVPISTAETGGARQSLEHPPGYQQNAYASDLTPDQRRARDTSGIGNTSSIDGGTDQDSMWGTAKNWAQQAGQKLQAVEEDVWKKINKQ